MKIFLMSLTVIILSAVAFADSECPKRIGEESKAQAVNGLINHVLNSEKLMLIAGFGSSSKIVGVSEYYLGLERSGDCYTNTVLEEEFKVETSRVGSNLGAPTTCFKHVKAKGTYSTTEPPQYSYNIVSSDCN